MAHEQFFYSPLVQGNSILIEGNEHQHLSRVMRKKTGDIIWVSDGKGMAYEAGISSIDKELSQAEIIKKHPGFGEPTNKISLAVGLIKASHWEILIEKAVELGVHEIYPLLTQHTQHKNLKKERSEKILLSAMKQSGRSYLPKLHEPMNLNNFLMLDLPENKFICDNQGDYSTLSKESTEKDVMILVGPEGGFSTNEVNLAKNKNFHPVLLSNRRLRTETACLYALSNLSI